MSDLISVVMPTHNAERYIAQAIHSCLTQSHDELELLVIDDASTDRTSDIIDSFEDARIRSLRSSTNLGPGEARNMGLQSARGAWITVLDSDDLYHAHRLQTLLASATALGKGVILLDEQHRWELEDEPPTSLRTGDMAASPEIRFCSVADWLAENRGGRPFYHSSLLARSGARYPSLMAAEDTFFLLRLALGSGAQLAQVGVRTYIYRRTPGSLLTQRSSHLSELEEAYGLMLREFSDDPSVGATLRARLRHIRADRRVSEASQDLRRGRVIRLTAQLARSPSLMRDIARRVPAWTRARTRIRRRRRRQRRDG